MRWMRATETAFSFSSSSKRSERTIDGDALYTVSDARCKRVKNLRQNLLFPLWKVFKVSQYGRSETQAKPESFFIHFIINQITNWNLRSALLFFHFVVFFNKTTKPNYISDFVCTNEVRMIERRLLNSQIELFSWYTLHNSHFHPLCLFLCFLFLTLSADAKINK